MNLKPLQDWAVIKRSEAEEKTSGGIIIPEVAKEKPLEGVIVAIGPGRYKLEKGKEKEKEKKKKFVPTVLKPGQRVIYQKYAEREVELDGEVVTLVREEDILGTVEDYAVTEKKTHALEGKKDGPVAIRAKAHVPAVTPAMASGERTSTAEKKSPPKKPAVRKTASKAPASKKEKPEGSKVSKPKKTSAKKQVKKTPAKIVQKKTAKKTVKKPAPAKKKVQTTASKSVSVKKTTKKVVAGKTAAIKTVKKKTAKPAAKKAAVKKNVVKKTAKKTPAKTKGRKK